MAISFQAEVLELLQRLVEAQELRNKLLEEHETRARLADARNEEMHAIMTTSLSRFEEIAPVVTPQGTLCSLCDSSVGCSHPRRRCRDCGIDGLAENMTEEAHPRPCKP